MTYATNLSEEVIDSQFLVVISPRKKILHTDFTLNAGSVYYASLISGYGVGVSISGTALTAGSSATLAAGEYYFDNDLDRIYIRKSDSTAPGSSDFIVVTYEIYVATKDRHWYRTPTSSSSAAVYYDAKIIKSPIISQASTDILFGFFPTKSTSIELINTDHFLESVISGDSFNKVMIKMWHQLGEISTANLRLVFSGSMGNVDFNGEQVTIQILDQSDVFDQEYRHTTGTSFYATSDFANLDPSFKSRPIRDVFGYVEGFIPVNTTYVIDSPTTSNNRIWSVKKGQSNLGSITGTVTGAASTTTVTNLVDASGFQVGDSVWFDRAIGTDEYKLITAVDYALDTITHSVLTGGAMAAADTCKRSFVGRIDIVQNGVKYQPLYGRDYVENSSLANTCSGFTLTNNFEATISLPATFSPNDTIYCRIYGDKNTETLGGPAFGANDASLGVLTQGIVVLYKLMKTRLGLLEAEIDTATFTTLQGTNVATVGFAVPKDSTSDFPSYKDLILELLQSLLLRLGKNNSDVWTLKTVGPLGSYDKLIEDDEIIRGSFSYEFLYDDIVSDLIVEYALREASVKNSEVNEEQTKQISSSSTTCSYLHKQKRQKTIPSLHYDVAYATTLANRLGYALGERRGLLTIESKNRFFDVLLGDVIRVTRDKLPGYSYTSGTTHSKDFVVIETTKSLNKVTLILEDQKGIEDNSASW